MVSKVRAAHDRQVSTTTEKMRALRDAELLRKAAEFPAIIAELAEVKRERDLRILAEMAQE